MKSSWLPGNLTIVPLEPLSVDPINPWARTPKSDISLPLMGKLCLVKDENDALQFEGALDLERLH